MAQITEVQFLPPQAARIEIEIESLKIEGAVTEFVDDAPVVLLGEQHGFSGHALFWAVPDRMATAGRSRRRVRP
jgi:hypothetical protein